MPSARLLEKRTNLLYPLMLIAAVTVIIVTAVSGKSAGLALRLQVPIMTTVALSLLALLVGVVSGDRRTPELVATYRSAPES